MTNNSKSLILDANIIFSFFKKDSMRRQLIKKLLRDNYKLLSPDFVLEEILNNKEKIKKFSQISEPEFAFLFYLLNKEIITLPKSSYSKFLTEAESFAPHTKDNSYFALALYLGCPIWSDEKNFKQQRKIKIFTTKEISFLT